MEDLDWLLLKTLHEKKSITKAAEALFISQPAITNRLRKIEDEFGVTIAHRDNKGVYLTPQGEFLAVAAEKVLRTVRDIKDQVLNMDQEVRGTLRIGASNFFTKFVLPGLLKHFSAANPRAEFQVTTTWSREVLQLLYRQAIHVGFVRGEYSWSGGRQLLFEEPICIAAKSTVDMKNLPALPRIDYRTEASSKSQIDAWWSGNYSDPPTISMNVDRVDTCKEMVMNGLGYAFLPGMILSAADNLYITALTDESGRPLLRKTWMLYHPSVENIRLAKAFINFVASVPRAAWTNGKKTH